MLREFFGDNVDGSTRRPLHRRQYDLRRELIRAMLPASDSLVPTPVSTAKAAR